MGEKGELYKETLALKPLVSPEKEGLLPSQRKAKGKSLKVIREDPDRNVEEEEDYDPHLHREIAHPTTNRETLIHLLKGCLGTGILAMPDAFRNSGLAVGFVGTILIGAICTYCLHVLVRSQYILCKRMRIPLLSFPESMKLALEQGPPALKFLSPIAAPLVDIFLTVYQLGICCVYIVFVAESIKQIGDIYWMELDLRIWMLIILLPLIAINMIRNLKLLAPFSQVANIITFVGLAIILYYVFQDYPSPSSVPLVGELRNFALFFGTVLFALEAVGVVIALENNMLTPKSFGGYFGVLNQGMFVVTVLYLFVGCVGYIKYGDKVRGSLSLNIPANEVLAQCVVIAFALAIYISYALQCYIPVQILWNTVIKKHVSENHYVKVEYILRTGVVLVTMIMAAAIPRLGLFISLFGALCLSVLGLCFPALLELCCLYPDKLGRFNWIVWKDIALMIFGVIGLVCGTGITVIDIIRSFQ